MPNMLIENLNQIKTEKDTKIVPENIKSGIQIFDIVGTLGSGDIKLFETTEEMNSDPNPIVGDLAVVYRPDQHYISESSVFTKLLFMKSVTLDEPVTDGYNIQMSPVHSGGYSEIWGYIGSSEAMLEVRTENVDYYIVWRSEDSLTYTIDEARAYIGSLDEFDDYYAGDFREQIHITSWNSLFTRFFKLDSHYLGGLYQYNPYDDTSRIRFPLTSAITFDYENNTISNLQVDLTQVTDYYDLNKIRRIISNICTTESLDSTWLKIYEDNDGDLYATTFYDSLRGIYNENKELVGWEQAWSESESWVIYHLDLDNESYSISKTLTAQKLNTTCYCPLTTAKSRPITIFGIEQDSIYSLDCITVIVAAPSQAIQEYTSYEKSLFATLYRYEMADSQLSLTNSNQLLPDTIALGKEGPVTGDGTIYDNLDNSIVKSHIFNVEDDNTLKVAYKSGFSLSNLNKLFAFRPDSLGKYRRINTYKL